MKLNLGCGDKVLEGWVNVDMTTEHPDVVQADITGRLPFEDDSADEAMAIHVIEHIYVWKAKEVLEEWRRVLKPGGRLALEAPDLNKIVKALHRGENNPFLTLWGLYGDQRHKRPEMQHLWCYTPETLETVCRAAGFVDVTHEPPNFHLPERDFRIVVRKPLET